MAGESGAPFPQGSKELVAFKLMDRIAQYEKVNGPVGQKQDRSYTLNLFAECLHTVNGYRNFEGS